MGHLSSEMRVKRPRPPEENSSGVSSEITVPYTINRKKARMRFTENQRKVLSLSWERGYLCDNEHYGSISEVTGLTRKQISN